MAFGFSSEPTLYIGEMKGQYVHIDEPEHFGFFFMKQEFCESEATIIDSCLLGSPNEGIIDFVHVSLLQENPNECIASNPNSEFLGEGELIGFPWNWEGLHEQLEFDNTVSIEVENKKLPKGAVHSKARIFFENEESEQLEYFATFAAYLYPIESEIIKTFLKKERSLEEAMRIRDRSAE
jgi:hypothetical protein